jgi:hypothetical protein
MNEWKAISVSISLFPAIAPTTSRSSALELYRKIWGNEPENFQSQANPVIPTSAQGRRGGLIFNCVAQPARIDFNLSAVPSPGLPIKVALIDNPIELRYELDRMITIFNEDIVSNPVSRVALNLHFLKILPSFVEANKELIGVIPHKYGVKVTDEEDFIFQINRPYTGEAIPEIKMNRITKWSVERLQVLSVSIPVGGMPEVAEMMLPFPQSATFHAASVHFDNNNIVSSRNLNGAEQAGLLHEALQGVEGMQREIGLDVGSF